MEQRTIFILVAMFIIVLTSSIYGAMKDKEEKEEKARDAAQKPKHGEYDTLVKGADARTNDKKVHFNEKMNEYNEYSDDDDNTQDVGNDNGNDIDSPFIKQAKAIKKTISSFFDEVFSKWGNQEGIMAVSSVEQPDDDDVVVKSNDVEGMTVRDQFKRAIRRKKRVVRDLFTGRK